MRQQELAQSASCTTLYWPMRQKKRWQSHISARLISDTGLPTRYEPSRRTPRERVRWMRSCVGDDERQATHHPHKAHPDRPCLQTTFVNTQHLKKILATLKHHERRIQHVRKCGREGGDRAALKDVVCFRSRKITIHTNRSPHKISYSVLVLSIRILVLSSLSHIPGLFFQLTM